MPADTPDMVLVPRERLIRFAYDFVREQSEGEWGDNLIAKDAEKLIVGLYALSASPLGASGEGEPIPVTIFCPVCAVPHVDEGEWATTRHHKTHQCQSCGHEWRPFPFATVGVAHPAPSTTSTAEQVGMEAEGRNAPLQSPETPEGRDNPRGNQ